jgi:hypothetical protein
VKLDLREVEKIYATGALVEPVSDDIVNTRTSDCQSFNSLLHQFNSSSNESVLPFVKFDWTLHFCRCRRDPYGSAIKPNTVEKQVLKDGDDTADDVFYEPEYDADIDDDVQDNMLNLGPNDVSSSDGEGDKATPLPRHAVSSCILHLFIL